MAALTLGEKTHWKERIAKRIDERIETIVAKQDPTLLQRVSEEARNRAYESLGINAQRKELEQLQKQKEEIEKREHRLTAEQHAIVKGTSVQAELEHGSYYHAGDAVDDAVSARAKALENDLLAENKLGQQILALRMEKENLLDTVWLATSSSQIKDYDAYCTSFVRSGVSGGNRRRSESFRPGLLTGALASGAG
jgi:esterase/lipase superfamily enzyme